MRHFSKICIILLHTISLTFAQLEVPYRKNVTRNCRSNFRFWNTYRKYEWTEAFFQSCTSNNTKIIFACLETIEMFENYDFFKKQSNEIPILTLIIASSHFCHPRQKLLSKQTIACQLVELHLPLFFYYKNFKILANFTKSANDSHNSNSLFLSIILILYF